MGISIDATPNLDPREWSDLLENSSDATVFHTYEWLTVLRETFPAFRKQIFVTARDRSGQLLAGIPMVLQRYGRLGLSLTSLPLCEYGGTIIRNSADEALRSQMLVALCRFAKGWSNSRFLHFIVVDFFSKHEHLTSLGFARRSAFAFRLELDPSLEKILMNRVNKKTRSQIRQAIRNGVSVKEVSTTSEIKTLSEIFEHTARRHGTIPEPENYITNIFRFLVRNGIAKYLVAYHSEVPIACALELVYKDWVYYAAGASYEKYWILRPNNLLIWRIIEDGVKNGCKNLNFGSVGPEQHGLARFKENWGANRFYYSIYEKDSLELRTVSSIWRNVKRLMGAPRFVSMGLAVVPRSIRIQ